MKTDIAIAGAGLVGASCALALARAGTRVALIEPHPPRPVNAVGAPFDHRVYAISPAASRFLETLGVWKRLDPERIAKVTRMRIWGDASAQLDFDAIECGASALAYIVESAPLAALLWHELAQRGEVERFAGEEVTELAWGEGDVQLTLSGGTLLESKLLVAADGANSRVRALAEVDNVERSYEALGVVANFETERAHDECALQWFRADGVLAWLPLPGKRVSIVWSAPRAVADELMQLDAPAFADKVMAAGQALLGDMQLCSERACFPLRLLRARQLVRPHLALIGDAAHVVHPLAGQGVNLGFADAQTLATVLQEKGDKEGYGDLTVLRRYERARKEDILLMQATTDALQRLFAAKAAPWRTLRNQGLSLTNRLSWLKNQLALHAMG